MSRPMMKCGHVANATFENKPCCAICVDRPESFIVAETAPDLTGRQARCTCLKVVPSSTDLAFFEYRGPGSRYAVETCKCGYSITAHVHEDRRVPPQSVVGLGKCKGFESRGAHEYDSYYCGHAGWD